MSFQKEGTALGLSSDVTPDQWFCCSGFALIAHSWPQTLLTLHAFYQLVVEPEKPVVEPVELAGLMVEPEKPVVESVGDPVVERVEPVVDPVEPVVERVELLVEPVDERVEPVGEHVELLGEPVAKVA